MLKVTASHIDAKWQLAAQPFAIVANGEWDQSYRVGGDSDNGFYAIASGFGCGRNATTPEAAIKSLLLSNGCFAISVQS